MKARLAVWSILGLIAAGVVAPLDAAAAGSDLIADSPLSLFGTIRGRASELQLFHHAFDNGTLEGTVHNGTLVDRMRVTGCENRVDEQARTIKSTNASNLAGLITFEVDRDAMVRVDYGVVDALPVAQGPAVRTAKPDRAPDAYLGPNPYQTQADQKAPEPGVVRAYHTRAFPTDDFLLVPREEFGSTSRATVYLEGGNLSVTQYGRTDRYVSGVTVERDVPCASGYPLTQPRHDVETLHTYILYIDLGIVKARQESLTALLDFWAGDASPGRPLQDADETPPRGYWYKNQGEGLRKAYQEFLLPRTYLTSSDLGVSVAGVAQFSNALGSIAERGHLTEVANRDVALGGDLGLEPVGSDEGGRRMRTIVEGEVFTLDVAAPGTTQDWAPYLFGGAGGIAALGLVAFVWPPLKWRGTQLLLFPLYARLRKEDILENPLRDDILEAVQSEPGISASELGRRLLCGWGTLVYHLTVLERMQLVSSTREGRHRRFFAQGRINYSDKGAVALLANPAARTILDAVRDSPGLIQKDLSHRLGLTPGTVAWHVERLTAQGLLVKEEDGRTVRYYPSDRLLELTRRLAA